MYKKFWGWKLEVSCVFRVASLWHPKDFYKSYNRFVQLFFLKNYCWIHLIQSTGKVSKLSYSKKSGNAANKFKKKPAAVSKNSTICFHYFLLIRIYILWPVHIVEQIENIMTISSIHSVACCIFRKLAAIILQNSL